MKYFFIEVFQFTEKTAEVIMQCLCKLSLYISIFNLDLLFLELARCFNECRVSDKEKTRRKYLKENSFKINQAQSYTIPSYSQLASLFDLITVYLLITHSFHRQSLKKRLFHLFVNLLNMR